MACKTLERGNKFRQGEVVGYVGRTKEQLVFVHHVRSSKVDGAEDDDERLDHTIEQRDREDENCLRIDDTIVDHGWCIEFRIICV